MTHLRKAGSLLMSDAVICSAVTLILILPGKVPLKVHRQVSYLMHKRIVKG